MVNCECCGVTKNDDARCFEGRILCKECAKKMFEKMLSKRTKK